MSDNDNTIYARVGGREGIAEIAKTILRLHHANPVLNRRYGHAKKTDAELETLLTELLCSVTGGSETYTGMSMVETHKGMNVHPDEFVEALDDILKALDLNGVSREDQDTILGISYSLKSEIVGI
jgi:hemoglobin